MSKRAPPITIEVIPQEFEALMGLRAMKPYGWRKFDMNQNGTSVKMSWGESKMLDFRKEKEENVSIIK